MELKQEKHSWFAHEKLDAYALARQAVRFVAARRHKLLFRGALTEASEAGGVIDTALDYGAFSEAEYQEVRKVLLRLCQCIYRLAHS